MISPWNRSFGSHPTVPTGIDSKESQAAVKSMQKAGIKPEMAKMESWDKLSSFNGYFTGPKLGVLTWKRECQPTAFNMRQSFDIAWWSLTVRTLNSWIPMVADNYSMTFSWLTHCWPIITRLKCQILAGECNILVGKFPFWMDSTPFLVAKSRFFVGESPFLVGKPGKPSPKFQPKNQNPLAPPGIPRSGRCLRLGLWLGTEPMNQLRNKDFSTGRWLSWLLGDFFVWFYACRLLLLLLFLLLFCVSSYSFLLRFSASLVLCFSAFLRFSLFASLFFCFSAVQEQIVRPWSKS